MVFSSISFLLFFLPAFLLLYFAFPSKHRNIVLLFSSLFFYGWGGPKFVLILIGTTVFDFYLVRQISKEKDKIKKDLLLFFSIFITVGLLLYFKYANFFIDNFNAALTSFGFDRIKWVRILLPIGISFFSFQKLTYAVDVYNKVHKPFKTAFDYLLFIVMFPQLIAGPIIRFNEIVDQIEHRKHRTHEIFQGIVRFIIGLSKKVLIANVLSKYADVVFDGNIAEIDSFQAWTAILAYTFQIYFDFSGYSDMAIGLGKVMGFKFPENFNNPYISQNITEFWRRWHITLGRWMKDYLYIPLGGNRVKSQSRLYFNLIFVFFISGLWHGASWNFVIWGLYHGFFLVLDRLFLINFFNKIGKYPSIIITFFITIIGWVLFRIENLSVIKVFIKKMFDFNFNEVVWSDKLDFLVISFIAFMFSFITLSKMGQKIEKAVFFEKYNLKGASSLMAISVLLLILCVGSITGSKFNPFIYFRF